MRSATSLGSRAITDAPIAGIGFFDLDRVWFKALLGADPEGCYDPVILAPWEQSHIGGSASSESVAVALEIEELRTGMVLAEDQLNSRGWCCWDAEARHRNPPAAAPQPRQARRRERTRCRQHSSRRRMEPKTWQTQTISDMWVTVPARKI